MSGSRAVLRSIEKRNGFVSRKEKVGVARRSCTAEILVVLDKPLPRCRQSDGPRLVYLHATKGWRSNRPHT